MPVDCRTLFGVVQKVNLKKIRIQSNKICCSQGLSLQQEDFFFSRIYFSDLAGGIGKFSINDW